MEQCLELEFMRGGFLYRSRDLGFRPTDGSRQDGRDGIRRGRNGAGERLGRTRVDDVDIGREFVLGQGDDVGQVERVREDGGDFGCGVECESDGYTFGAVHDDVFEGLGSVSDERSRQTWEGLTQLWFRAKPCWLSLAWYWSDSSASLGGGPKMG